MESNKELIIPGTNQVIRPGYKIKLGRFENTVWTVGFGWYSTGGNRPCCGWYLTSEYDKVTKPLQITDLDDVYLVDMCPCDPDFGRSVEEIDREILDARLGEDRVPYRSLGESIRNQIRKLKDECDSVVVLKNFNCAPLHGKKDTLYIDLCEKKLYVWECHGYVCVSGKGDEISKSDKNGYIEVNGEELEVYCPEIIDDAVSEESERAVQSKAVHSYVEGEVVELQKQINEVQQTLSHGIFYELVD